MNRNKKDKKYRLFFLLIWLFILVLVVPVVDTSYPIATDPWIFFALAFTPIATLLALYPL